MRFELRPVTTSMPPSGENRTWAASVAPAFRKRVDPAMGVRPSESRARAETLFEPGLTARTVFPSSVRVTAPCEARPAPVPSPPVGTEPAGVREPSAERE